jgi:hypothetical protein
MTERALDVSARKQVYAAAMNRIAHSVVRRRRPSRAVLVFDL